MIKMIQRMPTTMIPSIGYEMTTSIAPIQLRVFTGRDAARRAESKEAGPTMGPRFTRCSLPSS